MSSQVEELQAEVDYYRDQAALLRAKLYRWGLAENARLQELDRELKRAELHLRGARRRMGDLPGSREQG